MLSCLTHQAYADAIGKSTEFLSADNARKLYPFSKITFDNMILNNHNDCWKPEEWTDDTDQTILVMRAINDVNKGKYADYTTAFAWHIKDWYTNGIQLGTYSKKCCGVGVYVRWTVCEPEYLKNPYYYSHLTWENSDNDAPENGSLMRTGIIGAMVSPNLIPDVATQICVATHCDPRCIAACVFQSMLVNKLLNRTNSDLWSIVDSATEALTVDQRAYIFEILTPVVTGVYDPKLIDFNEPTIRGNVETALPLAIWGLVRLTRGFVFSMIVDDIAMFGGDADTNAAIFGVLAGAYQGRSYKFQLPLLKAVIAEVE